MRLYFQKVQASFQKRQSTRRRLTVHVVRFVNNKSIGVPSYIDIYTIKQKQRWQQRSSPQIPARSTVLRKVSWLRGRQLIRCKPCIRRWIQTLVNDFCFYRTIAHLKLRSVGMVITLTAHITRIIVIATGFMMASTIPAWSSNVISASSSDHSSSSCCSAGAVVGFLACRSGSKSRRKVR